LRSELLKRKVIVKKKKGAANCNKPGMGLNAIVVARREEALRAE
jgi:hypothetical protein